jgi:hypothetical protein
MIKEMALVFQPEDISNIGQRVKHINIIDYAQGFIYKERGLLLFIEKMTETSFLFVIDTSRI